MPFDKLITTKGQTRQISAIVSLNDAIRQPPPPATVTSIISSIDSTYWRTYDYCAAIIRLYASLERFILDVVEDWIKWISKSAPSRFTNSTQLIERYTLGVSEILRRRKEDRFSGIKPEELGKSLTALHTKGDISSLEVQAFYAGLPNLRLQDIATLLSTVEIPNAKEWILNFRPLRTFCEASSTTIEALLKDLVDRRNEAAHGNELPTNVLGVQPLKDLTEFVDHLCTAVAEMILDQITAGVVDPINATHPALIGLVEHYYPRANACLVRSSGNPVEVGINVIARGRNRCRPSQITSIQIDGVPHQSILPNNGDELGLQLPIGLSPGTSLYRLDRLPPIEALLEWERIV